MSEILDQLDMQSRMAILTIRRGAYQHHCRIWDKEPSEEDFRAYSDDIDSRVED